MECEFLSVLFYPRFLLSVCSMVLSFIRGILSCYVLFSVFSGFIVVV